MDLRFKIGDNVRTQSSMNSFNLVLDKYVTYLGIFKVPVYMFVCVLTTLADLVLFSGL